MLSNSYTKEVVGDTSTKQEWGDKGSEGCCDCCEDLDESVGGYTGVEAGRVVVEEIEDSAGLLAWSWEIGVDVHSGESDVDDVGQLGLVGGRSAISKSEYVV